MGGCFRRAERGWRLVPAAEVIVDLEGEGAPAALAAAGSRVLKPYQCEMTV
jgi:hypothetical protein